MQPLIFRPYHPSPQDTVSHDVLPHRSLARRTIFVTWRLSDSLPPQAERLQTLRRAQRTWLMTQKLYYNPWSQDVVEILAEQHPDRVSEFKAISFRVDEQFSRQNRGCCVLKNRRAIRAVWRAILAESKFGLQIGDGVICFNHVHVLLLLGDDPTLLRYMRRIKGRASKYLNEVEGLNLPQPIWQRYWFDHVVRTPPKLEKVRRYIRKHPSPYAVAYRSAEWVVGAPSEPNEVEPKSSHC